MQIETTSPGPMRRVLVTGGAGFIGSHLCDTLLAMGCEVMAYDCLHPQVHPQSPEWPRWDVRRDDGTYPWCEQPGLHCWFGDIRNHHELQRALQEFRPDTVIHLAARVGVGQSNDRIADYVSTNVTGTAILMNVLAEWNKAVDEREEALRLVNEPAEVQRQWFEDHEGKPVQETQEEADARYAAWQIEMRELIDAYPSQKVERVFVAGSMSSYGEGPRTVAESPVRFLVRREEDLAAGNFDLPGSWRPITEFDPLCPQSVYALTKAEQERLALMVGNLRKLDVRVGRFFNVYGQRQSLSNPYTGVVAIFAARALAGLAPRVYEDGKQLRDFISVHDVCSAIIAIMERGHPGLTYNIGTGEPTSIGELARMISRALGAPEPEITGQYRAGDVRAACADVSRMESLGWEPVFSLEVELDGVIQWVRKQPPEDRERLEAAHRDLQRLGLLRERGDA